MKLTIPNQYKFIVKLYLIWFTLFTAFRFLILVLNLDSLTTDGSTTLLTTLNWGFTFDNIIIAYFIIAPFLIISTSLIFPRIHSLTFHLVKGYFFGIQTVFLFLFSFDLPYFNYYGARINPSVFSWLKTPMISLTAIIGDIGYYPYIVLGGVLIYLSYFLLYQTRQFKFKPNEGRPSILIVLILFVTLGTLTFRGLRGSFDFTRSPIIYADAFTNTEPFNNLITINPPYSIINGLIKNSLNYIDENEAIKIVTQEFKTNEEKPFYRENYGKPPYNKKNVILVIMESMSAAKVGFISNTNFTPHLDSIAKLGLAYKNMYTSGIHTHNGIFSSLCAYPANMNNRPMFESMAKNTAYYGLPHVLEKNGYESLFFCATAGKFDNLNNFLKHNVFGDNVYDQNYFPKDKQLNNWGVGDHILFDYSISKLDKAYKTKKPFFATYMTISTHNPYMAPEEEIEIQFSAQSRIDKSYQYADWSIGNFLRSIANKPWYNNTLFVFIADHGQKFDVTYDMPLNYHHSPMIFFTPDGSVSPEMKDDIGLQIDLFPTTMGILNLSYINNTPGIDLKKEVRPYAYFTADDKLGVLDNEHFLIVRNNGTEVLYNYQTRDKKDVMEANKKKALEMKKYAIANIQVAKWYEDNRVIRPKQIK